MTSTVSMTTKPAGLDPVPDRSVCLLQQICGPRRSICRSSAPCPLSQRGAARFRGSAGPGGSMPRGPAPLGPARFYAGQVFATIVSTSYWATTAPFWLVT